MTRRSGVPAFPVECEGREVFRNLTGRWGMLIVVTLGAGSARYFELRDRIEGISEKMLAETLRALVRDGLVLRTEVATAPPKVSYSLTKLGHRFHQPLAELHATIAGNLTSVRKARLNYDARERAV